MSAAEFAAVVPLLGQMSEPRMEAARRALVDGETGRAIGAYFGWGRTAASNASATVWKVYQRYQAAKRIEASTARRGTKS